MRDRAIADRLQHGGRVDHRNRKCLGRDLYAVSNCHRNLQLAGEPGGWIDQQHVIRKTNGAQAPVESGRVGQRIAVGIFRDQFDAQRVLGVRNGAIADRLQHGRRIGHREGKRLPRGVDPVAGRHSHPALSGKPVGRIDRQGIAHERQCDILGSGRQLGQPGVVQQAGIGVVFAAERAHQRVGCRATAPAIQFSVGQDVVPSVATAPEKLLSHSQPVFVVAAPKIQSQLPVQVVCLLGQRITRQHLGRKEHGIAVGVGGHQQHGQRILAMGHAAVRDRLQHGCRVGYRYAEPLVDRSHSVTGSDHDLKCSGEPVGRIDRKHVAGDAGGCMIAAGRGDACRECQLIAVGVGCCEHDSQGVLSVRHGPGDDWLQRGRGVGHRDRECLADRADPVGCRDADFELPGESAGVHCWRIDRQLIALKAQRDTCGGFGHGRLGLVQPRRIGVERRIQRGHQRTGLDAAAEPIQASVVQDEVPVAVAVLKILFPRS